MAHQSLTARLQALADTYKNTLTLIQRLQNLPANPGTFSENSSPDPRLELSAEIHQSLKEQEDELESLRLEVDDATSTIPARYVGGGSLRRRNSEQIRERERAAAMVTKLGEDLNIARSSFRKAQLEAKRNADASMRKERELLFSSRRKEADIAYPVRRKGLEKLTPEELALQASLDVTAGLRKTHALLQNNIEQSQFAQQTLAESSEALASLGDSYASLDSMLKSSGGLVRQLIRSNKSDTWYLTTAFYIMVVTICWLVFRRILYGPLFWLVWQPMKLLWWLAMTALTGVGIVGSKSGAALPPSSLSPTSSTKIAGGVNMASMSSVEAPTWAADGSATYVSAEAGEDTPEADVKEGDKSVLDGLSELAEGNDSVKGGEETILKERSGEDGPPNPKKRMHEDGKGKKDEL